MYLVPLLRPAVLCLLAWVWVACDSSASEETDAEGSTVSDSTQVDSTDSAAVSSTEGDSASGDSSATKTRDAVPVETAMAISGDISSYLVFSSTVETEAAVEIHPEVSGRVEEVRVEEGDQVSAGDLLVRLENDQALLEHRESEVNLRHSEISFKRTEQMFTRNLISAQEYEDNQYQLDQARLRLERASLDLTHTEIRAPFTGMITSRQVQVGARVAPGVKLYDLVKLDDIIARVHVPGRYLRTVQIGQVAEVASDFLEDMSFEGYVKRISPVVDPNSGTCKVTIGLRDQWEHLRPGMFVSVRVVIDTHQDAILVPKEAVVYDGSDRYVFVVSDSAAQRVQLDVGYENGSFIEALSDIAADSPIIGVGQNGLKDQARVNIMNAPADSTADSIPDSTAASAASSAAAAQR
jgi:membrane fusion protein (multidrug efflux system)